jgi:hypothetical protein
MVRKPDEIEVYIDIAAASWTLQTGALRSYI